MLVDPIVYLIIRIISISNYNKLILPLASELIPVAPEYAKNTLKPIIKNVKKAKNMNISNIDGID